MQLYAKAERLPAGFNTYDDAIRNLSGGIDLSNTTVVQSDVLYGKTFRNKNGEILDGTLPYTGVNTFEAR